MGKIELNRTVLRMTRLFYLLGIWRSNEVSLVRKLFYIFYYILFQMFLVASAFSAETTNETIFLIAVEILLSVVTIKLIYLLWKKGEIYEFLLDPIVAHSSADGDAFVSKHIVSKEIKKFMNFVHSYLFSLGISFVFYIFSTLPMFSNGRKLPFFISFTLVGKYSGILFAMAYAFAMSGILIGFTCTAINVVIWFIMLNYSVEYRVLGHHMRNLNVNKVIKRNLQGCNHSPQATVKLFQQNCIFLIKSHQNVYGTIERFKSCFSKLFLAQIATSSITICISAYVLAYSSNDNLFQIPIFLAILLYGIFEIFLVMYLANDISLASDQLSYCLFESNWVELPKWCAQYIMVMVAFARRPHQLVIWKIYPMNLDTFTSIINGAYSMFNILQSFNN